MADATRLGRPQRVDEDGVPTRERLLTAATAACVEHGFEGATVADIASRADVSKAAVYNHFASKSELMVEACRLALDKFAPPKTDAPRDPAAVIARYLSPGFADARILQTELHLASLRHPDLRDLLATWHSEMSELWMAGHDAEPETIKTWFMLLLGLSQVDALASVAADGAALEREATRMALALFAS